MNHFASLIARTVVLIVLVIGATPCAADDDSPEVEASMAATLRALDALALALNLEELNVIERDFLEDRFDTLVSTLEDRGKTLDDLFNGSGVLKGANESQIFLAALFLPDPFVAFDATVRNDSDEVGRFTLTSILPIDPPISSGTFARAVLDVDLIDANNDGTAEIDTVSLISPSLTEFFGIASDNTVPHLTPFPNHLIGEAISGETNGFMRFDTGVVEGPTFDSESRLIELAPRVEFDLSAGDEVRLRGYYAIDTIQGNLLDPDLLFQAVDVLNAIPEPSTAMLLLTGICSLACGVRRRSETR